MSFIQACREFFGQRPDQSAMDFMKEIKALSETDRAEIKAGLIALGYNIN